MPKKAPGIKIPDNILNLNQCNLNIKIAITPLGKLNDNKNHKYGSRVMNCNNIKLKGSGLMSKIRELIGVKLIWQNNNILIFIDLYFH